MPDGPDKRAAKAMLGEIRERVSELSARLLGRMAACERYQHERACETSRPEGDRRSEHRNQPFTPSMRMIFYIPSEENIDGMLRVGGFIIAADQSQTVT